MFEYFFISVLIGILMNLYVVDSPDAAKSGLMVSIITVCLIQINFNRRVWLEDSQSGPKLPLLKSIQKVFRTIFSLKRKGGPP